MSAENYLVLPGYLKAVEATSVKALEISQVLGTEEGSSEYAKRVKQPRLDLTCSCGNLASDCRNALFVEKILRGLETHSIPNLKKREESIRVRIDALNNEKQELEKTVEDLDKTAMMVAKMIGEKKNAVLTRLQVINDELGYREIPQSTAAIFTDENKEIDLEEELPDFILETVGENLANLCCPDGQKIPIQGEEQIALAKGLLETTIDNPISESDLDLADPLDQIKALRQTLNDFGWTISQVSKTKTDSGKSRMYYLNDLPMKRFRNS